MVATVFTANPALNGDDVNNQTSFRIICTLAAASNGSLQVTIQPGSVPDLTISHASIGKWSGTGANTTATPLELKFGGASGFTAATTAKLSDLLDHSVATNGANGFSLASGDKVVVIYDTVNQGTAHASQRYNGSATNADTYYKTSGATSWNLATVTGYTQLTGYNFAVAKVETNSGGGGSQSLTPSKYTNANTFYAPTVARGARTLTPSLFSNSATFYAPLVKPRYTLTPAKYTDADSFFGPTVSRGARNLTPSLFSDGDTFYSPTVGRGSVSLHPSLFADGDTFYSPTVTQGPITLRPGLFVDTDAFYAPTVGRGAVTLSPNRYVDQDTFYSAAVTTVYRLSPAKFTDSDTFYAPVVGRGSVTLFPPFLNDADSFYPPTVEGGSPATQSLLPELFVDADTFYAPRVEGGAQESAIDQHDGLGPRRVEYVQRTPRKKRLDEQIHDAVERALQRIEHGAHLTAKEAGQVERVVESIAEQATVANLPDMSGLVAALDDVGKALTKLERKRNLERLRKYEEDLEDEHAAMLLLS